MASTRLGGLPIGMIAPSRVSVCYFLTEDKVMKYYQRTSIALEAQLRIASPQSQGQWRPQGSAQQCMLQSCRGGFQGLVTVALRSETCVSCLLHRGRLVL